MKPFFSIDVTDNKKNTSFTGDEFIVKNVSQVQSSALEGAIDNVNEVENKAKLPLIVTIIYYICMFGAVVLFGGIAKSAGDIGIAQCYENAPTLFYIAGVCVVVLALIHFTNKKRQKDVFENEESTVAVSRLEHLAENALSELGVPENTPGVDILSFRFKMKNSVAVPKQMGMEITPYSNIQVVAFADENNLYLATLDSKYAFPLSSLKNIKTVKKSIVANGWNKEEQPNKGRYKEHKLQVNQYGCIISKPYYILELEHNGEVWGIYFPRYELSVFESLTNLKAQ